MAQQAKDKKGNAVRFIRKGGKVIPIRAKGGSGGNPMAKKKRKYKTVTKDRGILERARSGAKTGIKWGAGIGGAIGVVAGGAIGRSLAGRGVQVASRGRKLAGTAHGAVGGGIGGAVGGALEGALYGAAGGAAFGSRKKKVRRRIKKR